jgi:hypothetical protein
LGASASRRRLTQTTIHAPPTTAFATALHTSHTATGQPRSNDDIFGDLRSVQDGDALAAAAEEAAAEEKGSPWDSVPRSVQQSYEQVLKMVLARPDTVRDWTHYSFIL